MRNVWIEELKMKRLDLAGSCAGTKLGFYLGADLRRGIWIDRLI